MATIKAKDPNEAAKQVARAKKLLRRELSFDEDDKPRKKSPLAQKKLAHRKKRQKQFLYLILIAFLGYGLWWMFKPFQSSIQYGICKIFIELNVPYPYTIYYSEVLNFSDGSVRVWFSHYDSFGDYRLMPTECHFKQDKQGGLALLRITFAGREVDQETVERFNHGIPAILANPPDLTYPTPLPNDPNQLQFDFESYRKKIL